MMPNSFVCQMCKNTSFSKESNGKVLNLKKRTSKVTLPEEEVGYDYTVSFRINTAEDNADNAVIFKSKHATFKLKQNGTQYLGFTREGKDYNF